MAEALRPHEPRTVAGPITGGILLAYEIARQLGLRGIFCERDEGADTMSFQRDFHLQPGERVAIVDDVLTTGGSVRKAIAAVRAAGGEPVAVALVVDRTGGTADLDGLPWFAATEVEMESFDPADCALCAQGVPLTVT